MQVEYLLPLVAEFEIGAEPLLEYRPQGRLQRIIVRIMEIVRVGDFHVAGAGDNLARVDIRHATVPPLIAEAEPESV